MAPIWLVVAFNFYLIQFLVATFQDAYSVTIISQVSEIAAYIFSGVILEYIGPKFSLSASFGLSALSGLFIIVYGLQNQNSWTFLGLILTAKFGISCAFNIVYITHASVFPTLFVSTSLGFCNFLARLLTTLTPQVSLLAEPTPMICFTVAACLTSVLSTCLQVED